MVSKISKKCFDDLHRARSGTVSCFSNPPHYLPFNLIVCRDCVFMSYFALLLCGVLTIEFLPESVRHDPGRCDHPLKPVPGTGRILMAVIGNPPCSYTLASGITMSPFITSFSLCVLTDEQEINVVFRPKSSEVYDDVIFFKVLDGPNAGGFNVPVRALLPTLQVTLR